MKIRWREHEILFVTILAVSQVIQTLVDGYHLSYEDNRILAERFTQAVLPFNYGLNVLFPMIGQVVLIYGTYLVINLLLIPLMKKISFDDIEQLLSPTVVKSFALFAGLSFLLAIGANTLSFFGRPDFFNYAGYGILAKFGFNDHPLQDIFLGFQRALGLVLLILVLTILRELAIRRIVQDDPQKSYRVLMCNNITLIIVLYILLLSFINPVHYLFVRLMLIGAVVLLYYLYVTFWLFPMKGDASFRHFPIMGRLLLSSFLCSVPFVIFSEDAWPIFLLRAWLGALILLTPIFWVFYQLRKDSILAVRGIQTKLAKSTADLKFLRAQINPHFLFNALNTLYGTALLEKSEHTAEGIQKLGDMMRFMLHENNKDSISMQKETEYLRNFIDLQKMRLQTSPNITVEDNIEEANCGFQIAPMLLIPLVENAFKHGISHREKSWISINLECGIDTIFFEVKNSLHKRREDDPELEHSGIGLNNVRERLSLIYPGRHELLIHRNDSEFIARLLIKEIPTTA